MWERGYGGRAAYRGAESEGSGKAEFAEVTGDRSRTFETSKNINLAERRAEIWPDAALLQKLLCEKERKVGM